MTNRFCLGVSVIFASTAFGDRAICQGPDVQFVSDTRQYLSRMEKLGFAGVVLVGAQAQPILAEGYGLADRERETPWTPSTVSTVGSITKQFTGAAILLLEERGRLSVDDPITKHFEDVPADKQSITLHHLLTHSSGIVDLQGLGDWDPVERDEFVIRAMNQALSFPPGGGYEYSNAGYSLLGAIIEQLTDRSWEQFVRDELFVPNGMYETGYILPAWGDGRIAQGYQNGRTWGTVLGRPLADDGPYWVLRANGGIHTTAYDMFRWARALLDGEVLSEESMAKYWAPHVDEGGGTFYGYGWVVMEGPGGVTVINHDGSNGIFYADMAIIPEMDLVVFVGTNVAGETRIAHGLLQQIGFRLAGEPYPDVPEVVEAESRPGRFAGDYELAGGGVLRVGVDEEGLYVEPEGPMAFAVLHSTRALDGERAGRLSARIDAITGASLQGDFGPLEEAYRSEVTAETLMSNWEDQRRGLEQQHGALRGHTVLGTALTAERDVTVVRILFERGFFDRAYVWDVRAAERLLGVSRRGLDPRLRFLPVGDGEFASWDGGISPSRALHFGPERVRFGKGEGAVEATLRR